MLLPPLLALVVACAPAPADLPSRTPQPIPPGAWVVTHGQLIDGTGAPPIRNGIVVILDDHIVAAGRAVDWTLAPETRVVDAHGGTILPGIINAHLHETGSTIVREFYYLSRGVTAVCDMAVPLSLVAKYADDSGSTLAARGFRSGPIINAPHGYPGDYYDLLYPVTNPDEARHIVNDLADRGADYIKIALEPGNSKLPWPAPPKMPPLPNMDLPTVRAVVEAAHARGKLVRVHIGTAEILDLALDGGVDVLDHIPLPRLDQIDLTNALHLHGDARLAPTYEAQLERVVRQNVAMVPTLTTIISTCDRDADTQERKAMCIQYALAPVHGFHEMGGTLALGDDSGYQSRTWMPLEEMHWLLEAGLTPMEVIVAGTRNAARVCGHGDQLGTLEPGKKADLIVVNGDPLSSIDTLGNVNTVILGGVVAK